jgi:toxin-antitoxin system PIN domain toxin
MKLVDVNILAYVVNRQDDRHQTVLAWWTQALRGSEALALPWVVISGFLRISTHPRVFPNPLSTTQALERVQSWLDHPTIGIISESDDHWPILHQLIRDSGITGKTITDAHLAAMAMSRRATLVSCDRDFARFRQLRWENPAG